MTLSAEELKTQLQTQGCNLTYLAQEGAQLVMTASVTEQQSTFAAHTVMGHCVAVYTVVVVVGRGQGAGLTLVMCFQAARCRRRRFLFQSFLNLMKSTYLELDRISFLEFN